MCLSFHLLRGCLLVKVAGDELLVVEPMILPDVDYCKEGLQGDSGTFLECGHGAAVP